MCVRVESRAYWLLNGSDERVMEALWFRVRRTAASLVGAIGAVAGDVLRAQSLVVGLAGDLTRSRAELLAENALLRQQLIVAARAVKRPTFRRQGPRS
jgi:hypothetical protein